MSRKQKIVVVGFSMMLTMVVAGSSLAVAAPQGGPAMGSLVVNATPRSAGVFVDGVYLGPASMGPFKDVTAGDHEVRVEDPRYEVFTQKMNVKASGDNTVTATLKALPAPAPPFGTLQVSCPDKYAAIKLNQKYAAYVGEVSGFLKAGILLNPGQYTVSIEPLSDVPHAVQVTVAAGKSSAVKY